MKNSPSQSQKDYTKVLDNLRLEIMENPKLSEVEKIILLTNKFRKVHDYGTLDFNNRLYDFFHIYKLNGNIRNIQKINPDLFPKFFPKKECMTCSGEFLPRPESCYKTPGCMFWAHKRTTDKDKKQSGVSEVWQSGIHHIDSLSMARSMFLFHMCHPELNMIIRATIFNDLRIHHCNSDQFDDTPKNIRIVHQSWHVYITRDIEKVVKEIELIKKNEPKNLDELLEQTRMLINKESELKKLKDDHENPDNYSVMEMIMELNEMYNHGKLTL
jgi:hypothetical protein